MTNWTRRKVLLTSALAAGTAGLGALPGKGWAADAYPDKPITMLVGYAAGGQTDLVARAAAGVMAKTLGQPINVANKPGAGGAVAAHDLQGAAPDGYTMLFHADSVVNSAPFIMERIDFKPDDFDYAGMLTAFQIGLVTQKDSPFDDLKGFIAWAKKNPNFSYAALSPEAQLYIEQISKKEGLHPNIVPVKGGGAMINALLGKQVVLAYSGGINYKYPDQLKMICATTTFRHPSAPDVSTIDEEGFPLGMDQRTTLFLPKGTPTAIIQKLSAALKAASTDPGFKKITASAAIPIMYLDAAQATAEMTKSYDTNKKIMQAAGLIK